jgi:hypothetical protein
VFTWFGDLDAVIALGGRRGVRHFQCTEGSETK